MAADLAGRMIRANAALPAAGFPAQDGVVASPGMAEPGPVEANPTPSPAGAAVSPPEAPPSAPASPPPAKPSAVPGGAPVEVLSRGIVLVMPRRLSLFVLFLMTLLLLAVGAMSVMVVFWYKYKTGDPNVHPRLQSWFDSLDRQRSPSVPARPNRPHLIHTVPRPAWADGAGCDDYGTWVELKIQDNRLRFRHCPAATAALGAPAGEIGFQNGEEERTVVIKGFWIAETETPQGVFEALMGNNPSSVPMVDHPVEKVSIATARMCCAKLTELKPGLIVRLPDEWEWEYACRAGSTGPWCHSDLFKVAWLSRPGEESHQRVASLAPNAWGLFDLHGNVCEWVEGREVPLDRTGYAAFRGGGFKSLPEDCRSARRGWRPGGTPAETIGFRMLIAE